MTAISDRLCIVARGRSLPRLALLILLLTPAGAALAHGGHGDEFQGGGAGTHPAGIAVDAEVADRIGLIVEPVKRQVLAFGVKATGQIEASPGRQVTVTNPVGGTVTKLLVEPGQQVEAGQALAVITSGELAELRVTALENSAERQGDVQQAEADLQLARQSYQQQQQIALRAIEAARTDVRVAQEQYDRDAELAAEGAIARRELLASEAGLADAKRALAEAESQLEVLSARTGVAQAQTALNVARSRSQLSSQTYQTRLQQLGATANPDGTITIKAPIAGTIADRDVTLGESAQDAGAVLMTIVDNRTVLATANIFEKDLPQVSPGQRVRITVASLPDQIFEGQITTIGSVVDGETRVVPVQAELDNAQGTLKPGMFASLEVLTESTSEAVMAIPQSAVVEASSQTLVFVRNGNAFEPVDVTLGRTAGDQVEVLSGLFEGDEIVTQRANQLYAQSLRGGSAEATEETAAPVEAVAAPSVPWWAMGLGSGAIAMTTFAAGIWWARRQRPAYALTIGDEAVSPSSQGHPRYGTGPSLAAPLVEEGEPSHK
ncbi:efflux RND transporter periplasmic adaptor subunit [filamentous cyanobacterium CCT1]|uniref:efflux RND transporter periplasmic adaptor subunit n=1 Tax=Nodosilinea sp. AN01ver1 TaxID=3423362 RepID=UPI000D11E269|nr:efflux RND transporter periplasmic adaptor subunit [filamentous cyanobacterium CCT1]PSN78446.1 efflux RND transporter periplasmic adaptor subunit [filamentous cyanobacterium CCP4]